MRSSYLSIFKLHTTNRVSYFVWGEGKHCHFFVGGGKGGWVLRTEK